VLPYTERSLSIDGCDAPEVPEAVSMVIKMVANDEILCNQLKEKLKELSATRVVNYLNYSFDEGLTEIEVNGLCTTPVALINSLPGAQMLRASDLAPITFWGGPPGYRKWYEGSLLTMLVDRIMQAVSFGNIAVLGRFMSLNV
jgi:hypothetical protein